MAVQKDYRVPGLSTEEVRALQQTLGVKTDGAWGKQSQAALDAAYGAGADPYKAHTGMQGGNTFGSSTGKGSDTSAAPPANTHMSGYTGSVYRGSDGRAYTDYGALLREDGFYYPTGAKISPNGMYYDTGNGWQFAKQAKAFDPNGNVLGYTKSSVTGLQPGSRVPGFAGENIRRNADEEDGHAPGAIESEVGGEKKEAWEVYFEAELARYADALLAGYGG